MTTNVVLFDNVCVLCNHWAQFIIKRDVKKSLKLASVQSPEGQAILKHYGMSTTEFDTLIYVENLSVNNNSAKELTLNDTNSTDNTLFIKTEAIFKILSQLGFPWRSLLVFKLLPRFLRDKAYLFIARNRYRLFGKKDHCLLPSPDHESRYLSTTHYRATK